MPGEILLANTVRWVTGTSEETTGTMEVQQRTPTQLIYFDQDPDMSPFELGTQRMLETEDIGDEEEDTCVTV